MDFCLYVVESIHSHLLKVPCHINLFLPVVFLDMIGLYEFVLLGACEIVILSLLSTIANVTKIMEKSGQFEKLVSFT